MILIGNVFYNFGKGGDKTMGKITAYKVNNLSKVDLRFYKEGDHFITSRSVGMLTNGKMKILQNQSDLMTELNDLKNRVKALEEAGGSNLLTIHNKKVLGNMFYTPHTDEKYREAILEYDIMYPMARSGYLGNAVFNNFRVEGSKVCWDSQKFVGGYGIGFKLPSSVKGEEITYKVHGKGVGGFTISVSENSKD